MTTKQIEATAIKLPKRDRARLANKLLVSLHNKREQRLLDEWLEEVERREKDLDEGREVELPFEQAMAELRASYRR